LVNSGARANEAFAQSAAADEASGDVGDPRTRTETSEPQPVYLVLSGGVSRGAYEAGYATELVQWLQRNRDKYILKGVAGTSAGAINAMVTAIDYCRASESEGSSGYATWIPIGWFQLFDESRVEQDAVFNHGWLRPHSLRVLRQYSGDFREDCDVDVITGVTRSGEWSSSTQVGPSVGSNEDLVNFVGWTVRASGEGTLAVHPLEGQEYEEVGALTLPPDDGRTVSYGEVSNALIASAAFPIAFPPVNLAYCPVGSGNGCNRRTPLRGSFYDGGVFENTPLRALVPSIVAEEREPLVVVVNLYDRKIPKGEQQMLLFEDMMGLAYGWLSYARKRGYLSAVEELANAGVDVQTARHRLPLASGYLSSFFGFFDRKFRMVDHALGAWNARRDLSSWSATSDFFDSGSPVSTRFDACLVEFLESDADFEELDCSATIARSYTAVLRGIASAAIARCDALEVEPMGCAEARALEIIERLPEAPVPDSHRRVQRGSAAPDSLEFQAFLEELRKGDFSPQYRFENARRAGEVGYRPEKVYMSLIEHAFREFLDRQEGSQFLERLSTEALLASQLPVPPTASFGFLINLDQLEAGFSLPLGNHFFVDLGVTAEWRVQSERREPWHVFAGGPAMRLSWNFFDNPATAALMLSLDSGVLFGPVLEGVEEIDRSLSSRNSSRPNAAIYAGIAPRLIALRRLQIDVPIRAYWVCDKPSCGSVPSANPGFDITFRIGWNFPFRRNVERVSTLSEEESEALVPGFDGN
jgi:predicted acylesterase/phospholipase RssA